MSDRLTPDKDTDANTDAGGRTARRADARRAREDRLAAQLRANLRRRKDQARAREQDGEAGGTPDS